MLEVELGRKEQQRIAIAIAASEAILEPVELQPEHYCTMDG